MIIVLNEWIFHDLWGENGEGRQDETVQFLLAFQRSEDSFVIPNESRWIDKAYRLMGLTDTRGRIINRLFSRLLYEDVDRALRIRPEEESVIPDELLSHLPEEDRYLVSAYLIAEADTLVTTDIPLHNALSHSDLVFCQMRDDFLSEYLR